MAMAATVPLSTCLLAFDEIVFDISFSFGLF